MEFRTLSEPEKTALTQSLKSERFQVTVVACGAGGDAAAMVRAIKAGAGEHVPPTTDAQLIVAIIEAASGETHAVIHRDPATARVLRIADQVGPSDASVLITGESGAGKEVIARHLHRRSRRANAAFISVNCAAIPEQTLDSELFGHEKDAFAGAVDRRIGKLEDANGGTLLLDGVTEMPPRIQAKLLRAIETREINRIGGNQPVKIDIRLLATSTYDIEQAVRDGQFRDDLYFRLNVVTLHMPALRERPLDIDALTDHFIRRFAQANSCEDLGINDAARRMLQAHHWRGNVRELENTIHRAVLLAGGKIIDTDSLMLNGTGSSPEPRPISRTVMTASITPPESEFPLTMPAGRTIADVERDLILETLQRCFGNRTHAADSLGISIRTLRNKLQQYRQEGLSVPGAGESEPVQKQFSV